MKVAIVAGTLAAFMFLLLLLSRRGPSVDSQWIVAMHMGAHDNTMVVSQGSKIMLVLELERIFGVRYFEKSHEAGEFEREWKVAVETAGKVVGVPNIHFSTAIVVESYSKQLKDWMVPKLKAIVPADNWVTRPHAASHAVHGLFDSAFQSALIITGDADERDGTFNVWWGTKADGVKLLEKVDMNVALAFEFIGANMDEMNGGKREPRCWKDHPLHCNKYAGTLMGYSSLAKPSLEWKKKLTPVFTASSTAAKSIEMEKLGIFPTDVETQRTIAATAQTLLEEMLISQISKYGEYLSKCDGLVIAGDLGLNVKANSAIARHFHKPCWVPEAPSDDGVPVGAIWSVLPPRDGVHQELMYLGLPVSDLDRLEQFAAKYNAKKVTHQEVSQVLMKEKIIGIMRGRQEVGPRALCHRSLVAVPTSEAVKGRLNKIKARQWFRPVAPTMNAECTDEIFAEPNVNSPYMSFAPKLKPEIKKTFPAIYHFDGSARPQTVTKEQNEWLHDLLDDIKEKNWATNYNKHFFQYKR